MPRAYPPAEMLALSQVIQPFLGATGPRWDIVRLPVENSTNQVIIVLVDPPQMGQPPFVCRASGDGLHDGRIYYRADGETREPTSDELDQLMARGAAKPPAPVELDVRVTGNVTPVVVDDAHTLEEYIARTRTRLLEAIPAPGPAAEPESKPPFASGVAAGRSIAFADAMSMSSRVAADYSTVGRGQSAMFGSDEPEKRTEDEYRAEIDTWEQLFRAAWPKAVDLFLEHLPGINEITVINKTQTFLHDVVVELHLDGAVEAIGYQYTPDDGPEWRDLKLPWPPRKWGPAKRDFSAELGFQPNWAALTASSHFSPEQFIPSSTSWKNGGSVDVRVDVGDLRPEATFDSDDRESVLVIRGEVPPAVRGTWRATTRGYNEVFSGSVEVNVADSSLLTTLLREYLGLT